MEITRYIYYSIGSNVIPVKEGYHKSHYGYTITDTNRRVVKEKEEEKNNCIKKHNEEIVDLKKLLVFFNYSRVMRCENEKLAQNIINKNLRKKIEKLENEFKEKIKKLDEEIRLAKITKVEQLFLCARGCVREMGPAQQYELKTIEYGEWIKNQ